MTSKPLTALAQALAGEFENSTQAFEQPAWFVSLRLWHRPLPKRIQGQLALFAEQANILYLDQPYRQRVMVLKTTEAQQLQVQYLALSNSHFETFVPKIGILGALVSKLQNHRMPLSATHATLNESPH